MVVWAHTPNAPCNPAAPPRTIAIVRLIYGPFDEEDHPTINASTVIYVMSARGGPSSPVPPQSWREHDQIWAYMAESAITNETSPPCAETIAAIEAKMERLCVFDESCRIVLNGEIEQ